MNNVELRTEGKILTIKVDLSKDQGPSKSGKTIQVASTLGNKKIADKPDIFLGLNVYKKR